MKKFFTLSMLFFLAAAAHAGIFIYQPKNQLITFDEIIMLEGVGRDLVSLKVNNQHLDFSAEDEFACGLVLNPGKNLIEVRAMDQQNKKYVETLQVLHLKAFPDVEELYDGRRHWARNQIIYLATIGLIEAYPDGNFYPANPTTRGELATWLSRIKKLPLPALTEDVFFDVPKEHWRAPYIKAAVTAGFLKGYNQEIFGLDDPVSRREAADVAVKVEGLEIIDKIKPLFIDVPKGQEGSKPIYSAQEKGLLIGVSRDIPIYDPDRALNRAEAAVLLARFSYSLDHVRDLFDFAGGYTQANLCKLNIEPQIVDFTVEPATISKGGRSDLKLRLKIAPRTGFYPISKVKVDLRKLGGVADVEMFDDGTHGDKEKSDLVYSLNVSLEPLSSGQKYIGATVIDRLGWEVKKEAALVILE
ncbi:MAG: S-layer homology domain-containing protein [bacterium]